MSPAAQPVCLPRDRAPRVLLLGNGILRLEGSMDWKSLLHSIRKRDVDGAEIREIPYAMQPEVLCGTDVEEVQRRTARQMTQVPSYEGQVLRDLLALDFDCVLTTNFSYEVENVLLGRPFTETERKKALRVLHGPRNAQHNTSLCYLVPNAAGRMIPVFHIHGDSARSHSLVLSYFSYAASVSHLVDIARERQRPAQPGQPGWSWLDWFLAGDIYEIGFGFDFSEFDVWWAAERKNQEGTGSLTAYFTEPLTRAKPQLLLESMGARVRVLRVAPEDYAPGYRQITDEIRAAFARGADS